MEYYFYSKNNKLCKVNNIKLIEKLDGLKLEQGKTYHITLNSSIFGKTHHNVKILRIEGYKCTIEINK